MTTQLTLSQSAIDTYDRCQRRYYLRYVRGLDWPAPLTSSELDWEAAMQLGEQFHLLVHQQALGLQVGPMVEASGDAVLLDWWNSYQRQALALMPPSPQAVYTEVELAVTIDTVTLVAKFDRVVIDAQGNVQVFDWKTGTPRNLDQLAATWQSQVYLLVACERGGLLRRPATLFPIEPERVLLTYWHARDPHAVVTVSYDAAAHAAGRQRLRTVIEVIQQRQAIDDEAVFVRTVDEKQCRQCPYRSYCERGRVAGAYVEGQFTPLDEDLMRSTTVADDLEP